MERTATRPTIEITATRPTVEISASSLSKLPQRPKYASRGSSGASSQRSSQTDLSLSQSGYTTSPPANYAPSSPANYPPSSPVNYAPQTPTQVPFGSTRSLADRFSLLPRPERPQPQPLQSLQQLQQSQQHQAGPPSLPSPIDGNFYNFDTDTESGSASSVLSVNTQATSVASSDITTSSKETRAPASKHVRHAPSMSKVRMPSRRTSALPSPPKTAPPSATMATAASRPAAKSGRTVHIQVMPPPTVPAPAPPSKPLQLEGRKLGSSPSRNNLNGSSNNNNNNNEKDLLNKIGQLEREAKDLQASNSRLNRELTDTREQLSVHGYDHKEAERSIKQERMARELAARDLQEQRQRFDEYRSNFDLQRGMLEAAESERDALRRASVENRMELARLTQDLQQRSQMQRDQEDLLLRQISAFEMAAAALENRIASQGKEVKDLAAERDALKSDIEKHVTAAEAFAEEKKAFVDAQAASKEEMETMKAEQEKLQCRVKDVEAQNLDLQNEIENLEQKIGNLQTQIDAFGPEKEELTRRLTDEKEALAKELDHEMDELEKDLHHEMDQLEKKLKDEKYALEAKLLAEKAVMERQLLEDKATIEKQLTDEKWDVQTRLEDEKAAIQKQLQEEKTTIQNQMDEEKAALHAEMASKLAQIETLETDLAGSKMANIALADEKLVLDKKLTEAREHFNEATENLAKLQTEITVFQANIQTLEADKEQAAKDLEAAREEHTKGLELAKEEHSKDLEAAKEAAQAKQTELEEKAKTLEADIQGLDPDNLTAKNRVLGEEKAGLEARITALRGELDERIPALQAEAEKVPGLLVEACRVPALAEQNSQLAMQTANLMRELDEARTIHAIVAMKAHELELRLKAESKPRRSNGSSSRSSSRSSSKDGSHSDKKSSSGSSTSGSSSSSKKHGRSSSSSGMVFVRNTGDRAGTVCIMRREEL